MRFGRSRQPSPPLPVQITVGGPEFHDHAGQVLATVLEEFDLPYAEDIVGAVVSAFTKGAQVGVAEVAAALIEIGLDARVGFQAPVADAAR